MSPHTLPAAHLQVHLPVTALTPGVPPLWRPPPLCCPDQALQPPAQGNLASGTSELAVGGVQARDRVQSWGPHTSGTWRGAHWDCPSDLLGVGTGPRREAWQALPRSTTAEGRGGRCRVCRVPSTAWPFLGVGRGVAQSKAPQQEALVWAQMQAYHT